MSKESESVEFAKLEDGRRLSYEEYGDPKGKPVFYFHGWPGSRLGGKVLDEPAKKLGIRIISPDRPGFGGSDLQPYRTILDWPKDVERLADNLDIEEFTIIGASGGGPYAYACAYAIPDRLQSVGVVAGLGPVYERSLNSQLSTMLKLAAWSSLEAPYLLHLSTWIQYVGAKYFPAMFDLYRFSWKSGSDKRDMMDSGVRDGVRKSTLESLKQGIKPAIDEWKLYATPWGFDVREIKVPVKMWHGKEDRSVPYVTATFVSSLLPNSNLTTYDHNGHYLLYDHGVEILQELTKAN